MKYLLMLILAGSLTACAKPAGPPTDYASLKPADARLATLYDGSCKACHTNPAAGAPLTHNPRAWAPRWHQGQDVLLDHVVQGYRAMPAGGQCAACTPDDFRALIAFIAGHEGDPS
ncbi:cytochrome c5 family protein [soil metagenome]